MKTIYCYNRKYPEGELKKIKVNSEQFIVGKNYKCLDGIFTNYDINLNSSKSEIEFFYSLCNYYDEEKIYSYQNTLGNEIIFSYDLKLIKQWRNKDINKTIETLEKRLKELKIEVE